jgi:transcriptional regulator with XRE-family HTH domain
MDKDLKTLHDLVRQVLDQTKLTKRRLEEEMGLGHGTLEQLLTGRQDLRIRHLLALARLVRVAPHQFLELGCPEAGAAAEQDLAVWLGRPQEPARQAAAALPEDKVRAIVREEVQRLLGEVFAGRDPQPGE